MATSIWKGHLTFGLVSVPVKLSRAARAEKVAFRQVHEATGTRVRQALYREPQESLEVGALGEHASEAEIPRLPKKEKAYPSDTVLPFPASATALEVSRNELAKGYEYEPGRYLVLSREEVDSITPATAHEMQILEFVKLAEVDPVYFETSYYVAPDRAGERAYGLLLQALRASGLVGIAQVAMHQREHVVVIRPGRTGIVLHTMFYEPEIRRENEYRTDTGQIPEKELNLALLLVNSLTAQFDASKYRDGYREKLDALIAAKLENKTAEDRQAHRPAPVVNILEALQRSLDSMVETSSRNPHRADKLTKKTSR